MLETHITRSGETMLIAEMDDKHLVNTIKLFAKKLPVFQDLASNGGEETAEDKLYDRPNKVEPEQAQRLWREAVRHLYPYLAEAMTRDSIVDDVHNLWTQFIGRSAAIEKRPGLPFQNPALPADIEDGYFEEIDGSSEGFDAFGHP